LNVKLVDASRNQKVNNTFVRQTQVNGQPNHPAALVPEKYSPVLIKKKAGWPPVGTLFDGMLSLCKRERRKTETEIKRERQIHTPKTYFCALYKSQL
jgi:hypothetical protein